LSAKLAGYNDNIARPFFRVRDGVRPETIAFGPLGYADVAIESYRTFRKLKSEGVVPKDVRFQVSIPTVMALVTGFVMLDHRAAVEPALEAAMKRDVERLVREIPAADLAIQWDVCQEVLGRDGGMKLHIANVLDEAVARVVRQVGFVPAGIACGIHLCYGDPGHKHIIEPKDLTTCVDFANAISARAPRPIDFIHMPVPRDRSDDAYFAPLKNLKIPAATELVLGLVHHTGGVEGTRKRIAAAERHAARFTLATECGLGRRAADTIPALLDIHVQAARTG
jgi:hypothetical protein